MKKIVTLIVALALVSIAALSFVGCKQPEEVVPNLGREITYVTINSFGYCNQLQLALNEDKFVVDNDEYYILSPRPIPIYKFDGIDDVEQFKSTYNGMVGMYGSSEKPSDFYLAMEKYDETYFENNSLLVVYYAASTVSYKHYIKSIDLDSNSVFIHVQQKWCNPYPPHDHLDEYGQYYAIVEFTKAELADCTRFDADMTIPENQG